MSRMHSHFDRAVIDRPGRAAGRGLIVRARAMELAGKIRDNAPLSVAAGKQSILTAMSVGCETGLELAWQIYREAYASEDAQEGARAFAEKRPPRWQGR